MAEKLEINNEYGGVIEVDGEFDGRKELFMSIDHEGAWLTPAQINQLVKFLIDRLKEIGEYKG